MPSLLEAFLVDKSKTTAREQMVESRFLADIHAAAAKNGYNFIVYQTFTDTDGYDLVLDDRRKTLHIQMKSVFGGVKNWNIHRRLVRPSLDTSIAHGLTSPSLQSGLGGGIVLVRLTIEKGEIAFEYLYSDYLIICAIYRGFVKKKQSQRAKALEIKGKLQEQTRGRIGYPLSMFVRANSPSSLLALMGFPTETANFWRNHMILYLQSTRMHNDHDHSRAESSAFERGQAMSGLAELMRQ